MSPLPFDPPLALFALAVAFAAVPVASAVRRLGAETRHRPLPAGWALARAAQQATLGLVAFIGLCLAPVVLRPAALSLTDPVGREVARLAHAAWQGLVLAAPLLWALHSVAQVQWPRGALRLLGAVALAPLAAWALRAVAPPGAAALSGLALMICGAPLALAARARWRAWRRPAVQVTRRSRLPETLAARTRVAAMEAQTRRTPWPPSALDTR